jgi:hypothetical protein
MTTKSALRPVLNVQYIPELPGVRIEWDESYAEVKCNDYSFGFTCYFDALYFCVLCIEDNANMLHWHECDFEYKVTRCGIGDETEPYDLDYIMPRGEEIMALARCARQAKHFPNDYMEGNPF